MLVTFMAPRAVCLGSAAQGLWADPKGEFLGDWLAGPVYKLFGKNGLADQPQMPLIGKPLHRDGIHYHIREGQHSLTLTDWKCYFDSADLAFGTTR